MTRKQLTGAAILIGAFIGLLAVVVEAVGLALTVKAFGGATVFTCVITYAAHLLVEED